MNITYDHLAREFLIVHNDHHYVITNTALPRERKQRWRVVNLTTGTQWNHTYSNLETAFSQIARLTRFPERGAIKE